MPWDAPQVVIIAGPNGAGKSTAAPWLLRGALAVDDFVDGDRIARRLSGLDARSAAIRAGRIMLRRIEELERRRRSFSFESTLAGRVTARRIDSFLRSGYAVRIVYLWLPAPHLAVERVKKRAQTGGHEVPEEDVRRRFWRSLRNFDRLYRPRATTWRLYDSSIPSTRIVAYQREGEEITLLRPPRWKAFRSSVRHAQISDPREADGFHERDG